MMSYNAQMSSLLRSEGWIRPALDQLVDYNLPGEAPLLDLQDFFAGHFLTGEHAATIARAFEYYWTGLHEDAGLILPPLIEGMIRKFAHSSGIAIIQNTPSGNNTGGIRTLGTLLHDLIGSPQGYNPAVWQYIYSLLADPLSINIRNRVAHGYNLPHRNEVALLLQVVLFLRCAA